MRATPDEPARQRDPAAAPARVAWAVEVLDPGPTDQVLEIGGGSAASAAVICERLTSGRLLAVDRSAAAVRRISTGNAAHLASGRLAVQQSALADLDAPSGTFDATVALNVNLFWVSDAAAELAVVRRVLRPGGALHVLYGLPSPTDPDRVVGAVRAALAANGFTECRTRSGSAGFGVSARSQRQPHPGAQLGQ